VQLNYEGGKFSKSRETGVFGDNARETGIPSEMWRYYLLQIRPETSDSQFVWQEFAGALHSCRCICCRIYIVIHRDDVKCAERANGELLANIGNLVQRVASFLYANNEATIPRKCKSEQPRDTAFIERINALLKEYNELMTAVKIRSALRIVLELASEGNKYMQDVKAWELKKTDLERCLDCLSVMISAIHVLAAIAEPFMPGFSDKVYHVLNVPHAQIPDTFSYLETSAGHKMNRPIPIFCKITPDHVEFFRRKFAGVQVNESATAGIAGTPQAKPAAAAAGKGGKKPAAVAAGQTDAARIDLRVGKIIRAWPHPEADKLWCEEVDVGEAQPRRIASGLRDYYKQEEMQGRRILVVCNLKPRPMKGFESQGMVLCAANSDRSVVEFIDPPASAAIGARVTIAGETDSVVPVEEIVNPAKNGNPWVPFAAVRSRSFLGPYNAVLCVVRS
jgi:methionyl-tRNA synthetase